MRALFVFSLLTGCSDYGFFGEESTEEGGGASTEDGGSSTDDSGLPTVDPGDGGDSGEIEVPVADAPVYANTGTELYEIDPATGAYTLLGAFHDENGSVSSVVDLAIDLDGHMVGANFDFLYLIDPTNAAVTALCEVETVMYALTFTDDGTLVAGAGDEVIAYDIEGCRSSPIVSKTGYETSGDLVGLPDGFLYWTVKGESQDGLVQVDPRTGDAVWLGDVGSSDLFGLGYDDGQLYGFGKAGEIVRISPTSGQGEVLQTAKLAWYGAATNPVVWGK
jgi:hypothetical protein